MHDTHLLRSVIKLMKLGRLDNVGVSFSRIWTEMIFKLFHPSVQLPWVKLVHLIQASNLLGEARTRDIAPLRRFLIQVGRSSTQHSIMLCCSLTLRIRNYPHQTGNSSIILQKWSCKVWSWAMKILRKYSTPFNMIEVAWSQTQKQKLEFAKLTFIGLHWPWRKSAIV